MSRSVVIYGLVLCLGPPMKKKNILDFHIPLRSLINEAASRLWSLDLTPHSLRIPLNLVPTLQYAEYCLHLPPKSPIFSTLLMPNAPQDKILINK